MSPRNEPAQRAVLTALLIAMLPIACFAGLKIGDTLPDLASFQLEGQLPPTLKGRVILLDFWASWCGPCKISFPWMQEMTEKYSSQGLTVIAVSVDQKRENMQRFLKSFTVSFTVVRDAQQKLVAAADVPTMPTSLLIDRSGRIRFIHGGFDRDQAAGQYVKEIEQLLQEPTP
jgi:thiol-disulfide isomerase/thioredoxin